MRSYVCVACLALLLSSLPPTPIRAGWPCFWERCECPICQYERCRRKWERKDEKKERSCSLKPGEPPRALVGVSIPFRLNAQLPEDLLDGADQQSDQEEEKSAEDEIKLLRDDLTELTFYVRELMRRDGLLPEDLNKDQDAKAEDDESTVYGTTPKPFDITNLPPAPPRGTVTK